MQGIHELPAPHRFSLWGSNPQHVPQLVPAEKNRPFDQNTAPMFPFLNPIDFMPILNLLPIEAPGTFIPQLSFCELVQASIHTKETSRTTIVPDVQNYDDQSVLHRVNVSFRLWTALVGFATGPGPIPVPQDDGVNLPLPEGHPVHLNTYRPEALQALPVPPLEEQMKPICSLWGWFLMHLSTTRPMVNTESSIHDEVHRQLLYPMNQIMEVNGTLINNTFHWVLTWFSSQSRYGTEEAEVSPPWWGRHVEKHRVNRISKAGLPDFLLFHREDEHGQCAMAEIKTWWSYPSSRLFTMLSNEHFPGGQVDWAFKSLENNIIKQVSKCSLFLIKNL